jgi:hypothetical protein
MSNARIWAVIGAVVMLAAIAIVLYERARVDPRR